MHLHKDSFGDQWDLDDSETYEKSWFPTEYIELDAVALRRKVREEIGRSLYYMICVHPSWDREQYTRVVEFGKHFERESREPDRLDNAPWIRKQLFLILDETENQC